MESKSILNKNSQEFKYLVDLHKTKRFELLEKETKITLKHYSEDHKLYNLLGMSLAEQGRLEESIEAFNSGLDLTSDKALMLNSIGVTYLRFELIDKAIESLSEAAKLNKNYHSACFNLGNAYRKKGDGKKSAKFYKKAIAINPRNPKAYLYLSLLYKNLGNFEDSKIFCEKALEKKPDYGIGHRHLSSMIEYGSKEDYHVTEMLSILEKTDLDQEDRMQICFGLGKAFEDAREFSEAFRFLKEGNDLYRSSLNYQLEGRKNYFVRLKKIFNYDLLHKKTEWQDQGLDNIFIVGMPRSGTSLVEQILASHSKVDGGGELRFLHTAIHETFKKETKSFPDNVDEESFHKFQVVGAKYKELTKELHIEGNRLVDKMPYNFMHVGVMALSLPKSKIILCKRGVMDNCFSIYKQKFGTGNDYAYSLEDIANYFYIYQQLTNHWLEVLGDKVYIADYNYLTKNQEEATRSLLKFCSLDWEDSCLEFHKTKRDVRTASAVQVRQPMYRKSVDLWRNYEKDLEPLYRRLQELGVDIS